MIDWKTSSNFKEPYISIGWDLQYATYFPHVKYLGADTETKVYYNGKVLQENECYELYKNNGAKWCRENLETKAYAFMLSDGKNFALFQNAEDFLTACAMFNVDLVFWYNARFDFCLFDYYFLTNGWKTKKQRFNNVPVSCRYKLPDKTYESLDGEYGQRYEMKVWKSYKNRTRNRVTHPFRMIDICNIFGGGLRRNLIDWKIADDTGEEVRKLEMDYANATIEDDLQYMINDTKGLYLLAMKIDEVVYKLSGYSLVCGDFITAGGLAKKSLLKFMYGKSYKENISNFKFIFPMTVEEDTDFRKLHLYRGGICFVSPYKINKIQKNIYKYDINSMYPTQMRNMQYPIGKGRKVDDFRQLENHVYVLKLKNLRGVLKPNMVPCWYDTLTNEYKFMFSEPEEKYLWLEELVEYQKYYSMIFDIVEIIEYDSCICKGAQNYVDNYYKVKRENKGAIRNGAKLFLNSAYGKLAQRIERINCHYELTEEGYCHLVQDEAVIDENGMMSVLVGSRITALSRVLLLYYIRTICKGNPKKYFIYCDTDSVHALCPYDDCDDSELGKMKCEGVYEYGKYLAPKTYIVYNNIEDNSKEYEVHTKGVNTNVVKAELEKCNSFEEASELFKSGVTYKCLTSLNVKGGKALIYIDKMLLNPKTELPELDEDEIEDW